MSIIKSAATSLRQTVSRVAKPNPVIVREMRARMRGPRAFWILTGYLAVLGLVAYGLYRIMLATLRYSFGSSMPPQSAFIGQALFIGLAFVELLFICFITPALTAGTISGEIERRTYDMLLATPLRPGTILVGKLVASLTYAALLILAAIPIASVIFLFGGVVLRDVVQAIGLMLIVTVAYGALGVFFSALTRRTTWATVLTYAVVLVLTLGSLFLWGVLTAISEGRPAPRAILYLNPLTAMASAIFAPQSSMGYWGGGVTDLFRALTLGDFVFQGPGRPMWQYTVVLYLAMTGVLALLTTQLVKPVRRWHFSWRNVLRLLPLLLLLIAGLAITFGTNLGTTGWRSRNQDDLTPTPPAAVPVVMPVQPEIMLDATKREELEKQGVLDDGPPSPPATPTPVPPPIKEDSP